MCKTRDKRTTKYSNICKQTPKNQLEPKTLSIFFNYYLLFDFNNSRFSCSLCLCLLLAKVHRRTFFSLILTTAIRRWNGKWQLKPFVWPCQLSIKNERPGVPTSEPKAENEKLFKLNKEHTLNVRLFNFIQFQYVNNLIMLYTCTHNE